MTRALAIGALALAALAGGCGDDVCAGIDGACVALDVRGVGDVDGLDITLSGAASGHEVAPRLATVATLPVHVALQLAAPRTGELVIDVVGVRLGEIVGGGTARLQVAPGRHAHATVELDAVTLDGGLNTSADLACPVDTQRCGGACCTGAQRCSEGACVDCAGGAACGAVCCKSGEVCRAGACAPPYTTASLYVYLCPDFLTGCSTSAFTVGGGQCSPASSPQAGSCYLTGLQVMPSHTYPLASCQSCPSNCSTPTSFTTPAGGFAATTYFPGISYYCKTPCTAPEHCP